MAAETRAGLRWLLHLHDWPLRFQIAAILLVSSALPLGLWAYWDLQASKAQAAESMKALLQARADQIARELDGFNLGYMRAVSQPGFGTTFRLHFAVAAARQAEQSVEQVPMTPTRQLRILVVDDDHLILTSLQETLEADGHMVTVANSGKEALLVHQRSHPTSFEAVITDLGMPYVDGRQVAAAVKAERGEANHSRHPVDWVGSAPRRGRRHPRLCGPRPEQATQDA